MSYEMCQMICFFSDGAHEYQSFVRANDPWRYFSFQTKFIHWPAVKIGYFHVYLYIYLWFCVKFEKWYVKNIIADFIFSFFRRFVIFFVTSRTERGLSHIGFAIFIVHILYVSCTMNVWLLFYNGQNSIHLDFYYSRANY